MNNIQLAKMSSQLKWAPLGPIFSLIVKPSLNFFSLELVKNLIVLYGEM